MSPVKNYIVARARRGILLVKRRVIDIFGAIKEAALVILILEFVICFEYLTLISILSMGMWTYVMVAAVSAPFAYLLDKRHRNRYVQKEMAKAKETLKTH